jgi:hypothetical protein
MADKMQATPRNALMGLLADALSGVNDAAQAETFLPRGGTRKTKNPLYSALANVVGLPSMAAVAQEASYGGGGLTRGTGLARQLTPEAKEVALMTLPFPRTSTGLAASAMGMADNGLLDRAATVWHGSPHKFDKFDSSKIGTGEGAQAYGHGLYLAENPKVAESYQNAGIGGIDWENATYGGRTIQSLYDAAQRKQNVAHRLNDQKAISKANAELYYWESLLTGTHPNIAKSNALDPDAGWPEMQSFVNSIDDAKFKNINFPDTGLYKVDLPDDQIARMLDWDKPLAKQVPLVQTAIKARLKELGYSPTAQGLRAYHIEHGGFADATGETLSRKFFGDTPEKGAEFMRQQGIPGIRYLDGGSRGTGQGTSNYVVFPGNEDLLTILERNGRPIK